MLPTSRLMQSRVSAPASNAIDEPALEQIASLFEGQPAAG